MRLLIIPFLFYFMSLSGLYAQKKTDILVYEHKDEGFFMLIANMNHFIGIPSDSTTILLISKQKVVDQVKLDRGRIREIALLDQSTISLYAEDKMKVYSFSENKFQLKKDVKHNTFEIPLQNPLIVESLIIGQSKIKPVQEGMLAYKYAFKDEFNLRDISIPFPVMNRLPFAPGIHKTLFFNKELKEAYIPLPEASKICIFNLQNKKKKFFSFPEHAADSEQWVYLYDHTSQNHFAVLQKLNSKNKLYEIKENFSSVGFIKDIDFLPMAVIGEYMYVKRKAQDGKYHHILVPFYTHDESRVVMEEYD